MLPCHLLAGESNLLGPALPQLLGPSEASSGQRRAYSRWGQLSLLRLLGTLRGCIWGSNSPGGLSKAHSSAELFISFSLEPSGHPAQFPFGSRETVSIDLFPSVSSRLLSPLPTKRSYFQESSPACSPPRLSWGTPPTPNLILHPTGAPPPAHLLALLGTKPEGLHHVLACKVVLPPDGQSAIKPEWLPRQTQWTLFRLGTLALSAAPNAHGHPLLLETLPRLSFWLLAPLPALGLPSIVDGPL